MFGTGSYGRNDQADAAADAAVLSKHLGRPVRVQYMRHEAIAWDPKGTASVNRSKVGLDAAGKVIAYENISKAFSRQHMNPREQAASDVLAGHRIAAEHYGWQKRRPPRNDQRDSDVAVGRGNAVRRHFETFIALIAEVRVHRQTGKGDLLRYVCARGAAMVVNPGTLKAVI